MSPAISQQPRWRIPGILFLQVLAERRSLVLQMVRRDFEQRFVGSAAGWLWTIIHPAVLLLSWVFVFQWCLKVPPPPGMGTENYTLYLFCGYLPWLLFQDTLQRSSTTVVEHANLVTKTLFPSEILPVTVFLSSLISHAIGLTIVVTTVGLVSGHISPLLVLLPLYTLPLGVFAIGVGWIFSSLQVYLRDVGQGVLVLLTGWFWFTPIFIDETQFPEGARFLVQWNPMAHVVRGYRTLLLTYRMPDLQQWAILTIVAVVVFILGGLFFRHLKRGFADVL